MKNINRILVIVQRSNGDVFYSASLVEKLFKYYDHPEIDILVNDDTLPTARLIKNIENIIEFSYAKKKQYGFRYLINITQRIYKKYDLSISLVASDRAVFFSYISAKFSISPIERRISKSWWKRLLLDHYFFDNEKRHILEHTLTPLKLLGIKYTPNLYPLRNLPNSSNNIKKRLNEEGINKFLIFHPCAQYSYKVYPKEKREKLISLLSSLNIAIIVTGGVSVLDKKISDSLPKLDNVYNFIGKLNLAEYVCLSQLSEIFIGMDTLNIHIASSQNKPIFGIYGPTKLLKWSPWSNSLYRGANSDHENKYSNIQIYQGSFDCVPCGLAGCNDKHGESLCLNNINPDKIFRDVRKFLEKNV